MRFLWLVVLIGCYAPSAQPGSPCDDQHPCPAPLVCASTGTCERTEVDAAVAIAIDAPLVDGCAPTGFDTCGDGIDQDCDGADPTCVANDRADAPIDVTAGGTFTAELMRARDDEAQAGCAGAGGRDVFYEVALTAPQVYYFDTFGSDFDTTLRAYPGRACASLGTAMPACSDDACTGAQSQLAVSLPSGTSCVIVDQAAAATSGALSLAVIQGGRDGLPLQSSVSGDTCTATNVWEPTAMCNDAGTSGGKDLGYFFTACPRQVRTVDARTCSSPTSYTFDTVLYVRKAGTVADVACVDDSPACPARQTRPDYVDGSILANVQVEGPGLAWVVVDGYDPGDCGAFTLTNMVQ